MSIPDELKEALAKVLRPKLWSEEHMVAHMEASPMDLEYCRNQERKRIDHIIAALANAGYEIRAIAERLATPEDVDGLRIELEWMCGEIRSILPSYADSIMKAANTIEALQARVAELEKENNLFRAAIGNNDKPCIYCGLDAAEIAKCPDGFPGCGRADDKMLCPHFTLELNQAERAEAAEARADALAAENARLQRELRITEAALISHKAMLRTAREELQETEK